MNNGDLVFEPNASYRYWKHISLLPLTLLQGTRGMHDAGRVFLPQNELESDAAYKIRLEQSILLNAYRKTCSYLAGQVFQASIIFSDDMPGVYIDWNVNIDGHRNSVDVFAKRVFYNGIGKGASHILVDMPKTNSGTLTIEEEQTLGIRPYFREIRAEDLIGWQTNEDGSLKQIRIKESQTKPDGKYGEKSVIRIRVFNDNGEWELQEQVEESKFEIVDEGMLSINRIPLISFIPGEELTIATGETPLMDLAELNLAHWRSNSDQTNILHIGRVPILFGKNIDLAKIDVGTAAMVSSDDDAADMKFVEISGAAIAAGQVDLKELEARMSLYGLQQLVPRVGNMTATEKLLSNSESSSSLSSWATDFESAMQLAYEVAAEFVGITIPDNAITINKEYNFGIANPEELSRLLEAVDKGVLSAQACFTEFKRRGMVDEHLSWDEIEAEVENQARDSIQNLSGTFFGGGQQGA